MYTVARGYGHPAPAHRLPRPRVLLLHLNLFRFNRRPVRARALPFENTAGGYVSFYTRCAVRVAGALPLLHILSRLFPRQNLLLLSRRKIFLSFHLFILNARDGKRHETLSFIGWPASHRPKLSQTFSRRRQKFEFSNLPPIVSHPRIWIHTHYI